jgi:hypothetical protein
MESRFRDDKYIHVAGREGEGVKAGVESERPAGARVSTQVHSDGASSLQSRMTCDSGPLHVR